MTCQQNILVTSRMEKGVVKEPIILEMDDIGMDNGIII